MMVVDALLLFLLLFEIMQWLALSLPFHLTLSLVCLAYVYVCILTPQCGVETQLVQRISDETDDGDNVQQRDLYDFVPLERRLELPAEHIVPLEVARIFLHVDLILGYIVDQVVGYMPRCSRPGGGSCRRLRRVTRQRSFGRGVLAAASLRRVAVQFGATRQQRRRTAVARARHGRFAAHALRCR